jgi:Mrp family chromosome partitioning ATPase
VIEEYGTLLSDLAEWKRKDREAAQQGYTPLHPARFTIQGQIDKLGQQKTNLLHRYEALAQYSIPTGGTNAASSGLIADLAEIKRLTGSVEYVRGELTNIQKKAVSLLDLDAKLHDLERQHAEYETNFNFLARSRALEHASELSGSGNLMNITTFEQPTPPVRDIKKLKKQLMTIFGGCFGCGLALAFLIDFVLDRSIKRRSDVERFLRLRVLQAIPDAAWSWRADLPWGLRLFTSGRRALAVNGEGENGESCAVTRWDPVHQLFQHAEGLRERLLTWFEIQNLNLKKPKMVGVTSCSTGAGVTTIASGLAVSLSRIGSGNVLLVNMSENGEHAATQSFHQGQPGPGLQENPVMMNGHGEQQLEENLFVAPANGNEPSNQLVQAQPNRLNSLIPNLKASDYDYIIFDMPRVSQTSSSARVAGYMDIVLLVLESEKTGQQTAISANAMMKESRANVAAVLNKCRRRVPALLSQDL